MATVTASAPIRFPHEPFNYDDISVQQSMIFSDSLKDLKNLSKELFSAAEYFELSYMEDSKKEIVVNTLKDYAVDAIVNTVDHLGHAAYKVNDLLEEKVDEVSQNEFRVSCIEQRLRTCQYHIDLKGLSQQSLLINTPKYQKRYILPVGETMAGAMRAISKNQGCSINVGDEWHQFRNGIVPNGIVIGATTKETPPSMVSKGLSPSPSPKLSHHSRNSSFSNNMPNKNFEKGTASPRLFPLVCPISHLSNPTFLKCSQPSTPNRGRPAALTHSFERQMSISEPRKPASMHLHVGSRSPKDIEQLRSKSMRLLKALLSRRKPKKDEMLYTYLDEY